MTNMKIIMLLIKLFPAKLRAVIRLGCNKNYGKTCDKKVRAIIQFYLHLYLFIQLPTTQPYS